MAVAVALLALLLPQDGLRDLVDRLDSAAPADRDAAERDLRALDADGMRRLIPYSGDLRPEVRARILKVLSAAPPGPLLEALFSENRAAAAAAADVLGGRADSQVREMQLWNEVCSDHATPRALALQFSARVPVVLGASALASDERLTLRGGPAEPEHLNAPAPPGGLRWAVRERVLFLGTEPEQEAWTREPPLRAVFRDLLHADARRRELAARSLGRCADDEFSRALSAVAAGNARAREVLVWSLVGYGPRPRLPELRKPLEDALSGPSRPLAAAACSVFRALPYGPDPGLLDHQDRETRYLAILATRTWVPALEGRFADTEPEIRLVAYQAVHRLAPPDALPWKAMLEVRQGLPLEFKGRAYTFSPDAHPATEAPLLKLLAADQPLDRSFAYASLLSTRRAELADRVLALAAGESDPDVLKTLVDLMRFPAVRDRQAALDFLLRRARAGDAGAVHPLGQSAVPRALDHLAALTDHPREEVRKEVVNALWIWKRKDPRDRAVALLEARREAETSVEIRKLIDRALEPPAGGGGARGRGTLRCWACGQLPAGVLIEVPSFAGSWR